jgi:hypothetical protein
MNWQSIPISDIIIALLPLISALCAYAYQQAIQRMPAQQRENLLHFASMSANKIEQVYPIAGSANKKQLATELVKDMFKAFKLPIPDERVIDAAIESAVLAINQSQALADPYNAAKLTESATTTALSKVLGPEPIILPIAKEQAQAEQIAGDSHE